SQDVAIAPNDTIEVTGVRRMLDNETNFIASEIEHAGRIIELRDDNGYPIWMNRRTDRSPM
ncbi:MAG: DNA-binding protein, partial [Cyanobacteria bacterium P01_A01_bin.37]